MATAARSPTPQSPRPTSSLPTALAGDTFKPRSPAALPTLGSTTLPTINEDSVLHKSSETFKDVSSTSPAKQLHPLASIEATSPKLSKPTTLRSPRRSPAPLLTGAAAMADAKRKRQAEFPSRETTPNPGVVAMQRLMGDNGISKASDAPATNKLSEPMRLAAEKIQIPDNQDTSGGNSVQTSPVSLSSFGTTDLMNGSGGALTATSTDGTDTINAPFVAEPAEMNDQNTPADGASTASTAEEPESNKAFSYPGLPAQAQQQNDAPPPVARGMSYPGIRMEGSSKSSSPSVKRHKCPYCATDFTRHHNLKSHLLTHSQEKPYVCSTCQARFRRLHDLKRHTKLHTGERPHTCEKCGRRFARGDALARHSKGPSGCAGRRSSFGGDDDLGDGMGDGMEGIEYTNDEDDEGGTDLSRRVSEPSRKRLQVETPQDSGRTVYRQPSSTYPPTQHRPGDMGPPASLHNNHNGNNSTSPRDGHASAPTLSTGYFQNYNQGGLIESPKPISPGQPPDQHRLSVDAGSAGAFGRNRSPSLTTQFQQTHFGRGSGGRTPPQPPQSQFPSTNHLSSSTNNQLPPLTLSTSALRRPSLTGPGHSMLHQQHPPQSNNASNPASASSHGQSSGSSMREILGTGAGSLGGGGDSEMWQHLRQLEGKFVRMQDEYELRISRLQEEVISLRSQLTNSQTGGPAGSYPGEPRY